MEEPPSATWWTLDSLQHGHTVAETLAYADWVSDFAKRSSRPGVVTCRRM